MIISRRKYEEELSRARNEVLNDVNTDLRFDAVWNRIHVLEEMIRTLQVELAGGSDCAKTCCNCKVKE